MRKIIFQITLSFVALFATVTTTQAASYRINSPSDVYNLDCTLGDINCKYYAPVIFTNDTTQTLYDTTLWTHSPYLQIQGFDGSWTSRTTSPYSYNPRNGPNILVKVIPPNQIGTFYSSMYIDGKVCNFNVSPADCVYYGGKEFRVVINVSSASPSPTLTPSPAPTILPTATPTTAVTPTPTAVPTLTVTNTPTPMQNKNSEDETVEKNDDKSNKKNEISKEESGSENKDEKQTISQKISSFFSRNEQDKKNDTSNEINEDQSQHETQYDTNKQSLWERIIQILAKLNLPWLT